MVFFAKAGGLNGNGCVFAVTSLGISVLGHRALFHSVNRLARDTIKDEQQTHLGDLRNCRHGSSAAANVK